MVLARTGGIKMPGAGLINRLSIRSLIGRERKDGLDRQTQNSVSPATVRLHPASDVVATAAVRSGLPADPRSLARRGRYDSHGLSMSPGSAAARPRCAPGCHGAAECLFPWLRAA